MSNLLGAILRRFGHDGDGRVHHVATRPSTDLPDETYHVIYDDHEDALRFAHLKLDDRKSGLYREQHSVAVPRWLAKYLSFDAKPTASDEWEEVGKT